MQYNMQFTKSHLQVFSVKIVKAFLHFSQDLKGQHHHDQQGMESEC